MDRFLGIFFGLLVIVIAIGALIYIWEPALRLGADRYMQNPVAPNPIFLTGVIVASFGGASKSARSPGVRLLLFVGSLVLGAIVVYASTAIGTQLFEGKLQEDRGFGGLALLVLPVFIALVVYWMILSPESLELDN